MKAAVRATWRSLMAAELSFPRPGGRREGTESEAQGPVADGATAAQGLA